jgi:hypothetical protein
MAGLTNALQELRAERTRTQSQVEKLDRAISLLVSLNGTGAPKGTSHKTTRPVRVVSAASRRKMARAQKLRWAKARRGAPSGNVEKKTAVSAPARRTISAASRRKMAQAQKARWAKLKAAKK